MDNSRRGSKDVMATVAMVVALLATTACTSDEELAEEAFLEWCRSKHSCQGGESEQQIFDACEDELAVPEGLVDTCAMDVMAWADCHIESDTCQDNSFGHHGEGNAPCATDDDALADCKATLDRA